jgi:hypothetical protein
VGDILPSEPFLGYWQGGKAGGEPVPVELADLYNPTGDAVFSADSPFPGSQKPRALLVCFVSVWSGPCNLGAAERHGPLHASLRPNAMLIELLIDGVTPGKAPTSQELYNWAHKYETTYPTVADIGGQVLRDLVPRVPSEPSGPLSPFDRGPRWSSTLPSPMYLVVDARTMIVMDSHQGRLDDSARAFLESVANEATVLDAGPA